MYFRAFYKIILFMNYLWKMYTWLPQFSFWISITLVKIYLSCIITNRGKNTFELVGTVLNYFFGHVKHLRPETRHPGCDVKVQKRGKRPLGGINQNCKHCITGSPGHTRDLEIYNSNVNENVVKWKKNNCCYVLTLSSELEIWSFHVVELQRTEKKNVHVQIFTPHKQSDCFTH